MPYGPPCPLHGRLLDSLQAYTEVVCPWLSGEPSARYAKQTTTEQVLKQTSSAKARWAAFLNTLQTKAVIGFSLFGVCQDVMGKCQLLELLLGVFIGVLVGMVLLSQFPVSLHVGTTT